MDLLYYYWISTIDGVGPRRICEMVNYFGSIENAWNGTYNDYKAISIQPNIIDRIIERKNRDRLMEEINGIRAKGIGIITIDHEEYPNNLKNICDPPLILYYKGSFKKCKKYLAVIGSRKCTPYGRMVTRSLAKLLAGYDIGIISGMARGIDTEAHIGALEGSGYTCAVLGCGCDVVYPPENKRIMMEIELKGTVISEYPPGTEPASFNFPARNRIISGISDGILVVEAGEKSGSLITVNYGLEQGKDIFAIPGSILSGQSQGTNMLIRDGAALVTCAEDILNEFEMDVKPSEHSTSCPDLSQREKALADIIKDSPIHIDDLMEKVTLRISEVNSVLTSLELKGVIKVLPGKFIVRTL